MEPHELSHAQLPYQRLATAARLWNYVKYLSPRVTNPAIDWDAELVNAIPKVLAARSNEDFHGALSDMLGSLHDPLTYIREAGEVGTSEQLLLPQVAPAGPVPVVTFRPGDPAKRAQALDALIVALSKAGAAVFDLRGTKDVGNALASTLMTSKPCQGLKLASREHTGYARADDLGNDGLYRSTWKLRDTVHFPLSPSAAHSVFLINGKTVVPLAVAALEDCGAAAIVAEEDVTAGQLAEDELTSTFENLPVTVRTHELLYPDGTTGLSANVVLHKRGAAALAAATALALAGNWPSPEPRAKLALPAAFFAEKGYEQSPYPSHEYRLLAAARIWGVLNYFHPYKALYGEDWDAVLTSFFPRMADASNALAYHLAVAEMLCHTHDSHVRASSRELSHFDGSSPVGVQLHWIENQPVVVRVFNPELRGVVKPGDAVTRIEDEPVQKRMEELAGHIPGSTQQAVREQIMVRLLAGAAGTGVRVTLTGADGERAVTLERSNANIGLYFQNEGRGEAYYLINPKIGYVDLERLQVSQVDGMFKAFEHTSAIVMDMRGYPQGTAWSIAPRLAAKPSMVDALFRINTVTADGLEGNTIGSTLWEQRISTTTKPRYAGKTVMLIDERAGSQAEHSGLLYRAANGTIFVGSPTEGVDGDETFMVAPGGIWITFSGSDVRWPDGKQLQRVGLVPDVTVYPTIEGVRAGRDELLDRAVAYVEGGK